jgi:hypothetical protein
MKCGTDPFMKTPYHYKGTFDEVLVNTDAYKDKKETPKLILQLVTTPAEDETAGKAAESWFQSHPDWTVYNANCADLTKSVIKAGSSYDPGIAVGISSLLKND